MTLKTVGVRLVIDGLSQFKVGMAQANSMLAGLTSATRSTSGFSKFGNAATAAFLGTSAAIGIAGGAAVYALTDMTAASVESAAEFEYQMSAVQAISGATGDAMDSLNQKALQLGRDTKYTAVESGAAMEMLARNGISYTDILDGAAQATVNLAAATGGDLSITADIATDVLRMFNIEAKNMEDAVDNISGVVVSSKFDIGDYRLALSQAGGVSAQFGQSIEDYNAALAGISNYFATGRQAGTSYKVMLQRMIPRSNQAAAAMQELGLNFFDDNGQFLAIDDIAGQLQATLGNIGGIEFENSDGTLKSMSELTSQLDNSLSPAMALVGGRTAAQTEQLTRLQSRYESMSNDLFDYQSGVKGVGLSEEARGKKVSELNQQLENTTAAMAPLLAITGQWQQTTRNLTQEQVLTGLFDIFGTDAVRAAVALGNTGQQGIIDKRNQIDAVSAADQARARLENLKGQMVILRSSLDTVALSIGIPFQDGLTALVQKGVIPFVNGISDAIFAISGPASKAFEAFANAITLKGVPIGAKLRIGVKSMLNELGVIGPDAERIMGRVTSAIDMVGNAIQFVKDNSSTLLGVLKAVGVAWAGMSFIGIFTTAAKVIGGLSGAMSGMGAIGMGSGPLGAIAGVVGNLVQGFGTLAVIMGTVAVAALAWQTNFLGIRDAITGLWNSLDRVSIKKTFDDTFASIDFSPISDAFLSLKTNLGGIGTAVVGIANTIFSALGIDPVVSFGELMTNVINGFIVGVGSLIQSFANGFAGLVNGISWAAGQIATGLQWASGWVDYFAARFPVAFGVVSKTLASIAAIFGGGMLISSIGKFFATLGGGSGILLRLIGFVATVGARFTGLGGIVRMAFGGAQMAVGALVTGLGLLLSPIGLVVAGATAIHAAWTSNLFGIRDVALDVFGGIGAAIGGLFASGRISTFFADVKTVGIGDAFGNLKQTPEYQSLSAQVGTSYERASGYVQRFGERVSTVGQYFSAVVDDGQAMNAWLANLPEEWRGPIEQAGTQVAALRNNMFGSDMEFSSLSNYADAAGQYFQMVISDGDAMNDWLTHLPAKWRGPIESMGTMLSGVRDSLGGDAVFADLGGNVSSLGQYFGAIMDDGVSLTTVLNGLPSAWRGPVAEAGDMLYGLREALGGDKTFKGFTGLLSGLGNAIPDSFTMGKGVFKNFFGSDSVAAFKTGASNLMTIMSASLGKGDFSALRTSLAIVPSLFSRLLMSNDFAKFKDGMASSFYPIRKAAKDSFAFAAKAMKPVMKSLKDMGIPMDAIAGAMKMSGGIFGSFGKYLSASLSDTASWAMDFGKILWSAGSTVMGGFATGDFSGMSDVFQNMGYVLADGLVNQIGNIGDLFSNIGGALGLTLPEISFSEQINAWWDTMTAGGTLGFTGVASNIYTYVADAISNITWSGIGDSIKSGIESVLGIEVEWPAKGTSFVEWAKWIGKLAWPAIGETFATWSKWIGEVAWPKLGVGVTSFATWVGTWLKGVSWPSAPTLTSFANWVGTWLLNIKWPEKPTLNAFTDWVTSWIPKIDWPAKPTIDSFSTWVTSWFSTDFSWPEITLPEITLPEITFAAFTLPEITLPEMKFAGFTIPEIVLPEIKFAGITLPEVTLPEIKFSEIKLPKVKLPEIKFDMAGVDWAGTVNGWITGASNALATGIDGIDWSTVSDKIITWVDAAATAINNVDFEGIGQKIGTAIGAVIRSAIDWFVNDGGWITTLKVSFIALMALLNPAAALAIGAVVWGLTGENFAGLRSSIKSAIDKIDWAKMGLSFASLGATVAAAIGDFMDGLIAGIISELTGIDVEKVQSGMDSFTNFMNDPPGVTKEWVGQGVKNANTESVTADLQTQLYTPLGVLGAPGAQDRFDPLPAQTAQQSAGTENVGLFKGIWNWLTKKDSQPDPVQQSSSIYNVYDATNTQRSSGTKGAGNQSIIPDTLPGAGSVIYLPLVASGTQNASTQATRTVAESQPAKVVVESSSSPLAVKVETLPAPAPTVISAASAPTVISSATPPIKVDMSSMAGMYAKMYGPQQPVYGPQPKPTTSTTGVGSAPISPSFELPGWLKDGVQVSEPKWLDKFSVSEPKWLKDKITVEQPKWFNSMPTIKQPTFWGGEVGKVNEPSFWGGNAGVVPMPGFWGSSAGTIDKPSWWGSVAGTIQTVTVPPAGGSSGGSSSGGSSGGSSSGGSSGGSSSGGSSSSGGGLPRNYTGAKSFRGGLTSLAEKGMEYVKQPGMPVQLFDKKTTATLKPGTRIFNNSISKRIDRAMAKVNESRTASEMSLLSQAGLMRNGETFAQSQMAGDSQGISPVMPPTIGNSLYDILSMGSMDPSNLAVSAVMDGSYLNQPPPSMSQMSSVAYGDRMNSEQNFNLTVNSMRSSERVSDDFFMMRALAGA